MSATFPFQATYITKDLFQLSFQKSYSTIKAIAKAVLSAICHRINKDLISETILMTNYLNCNSSRCYTHFKECS